MLEEMGIAPVWRLRSPATLDAVAVEATLRTTGAEAGAVEERAASLALSETEPTAGLSSAEPVPPSRRRVVPIRPADTPELEARRGGIMQMDWSALEAAVAACVACPLHEKRNRTVLGVGDTRAQWLFVGEGPGAEEDMRGEPFVGHAGRLLDNMLAAIDLRRGANVYIANVVKCRPPGNRNPEPVEMSCCEPYLARQIELIGPKLIVALGKVAVSHLLGTDAAVASLRGRLHQYRGTPLVVTYHPAYLLRTPNDKSKAWADLCFARETMASLVASPTADRAEQPPG
jgi:DNA polymerase